MSFLERMYELVNNVLLAIAGACLLGMMLLTCTNIASRAVWIPVQGTVELVGFLGALTAALVLGDTQRKRGHIAVDILVQAFPAPVRRIADAIGHMLYLGFFTIVAWQITKKATILWKSGEVTETLHIIFYPFLYAVAFGCGFVALVLLIDVLKMLAEFVKGTFHWIWRSPQTRE